MTPPPEQSRQLIARGDVWGEEGFIHLVVLWKDNSQTYIAQCPNLRLLAFDNDPNALNEVEGTLIPKDLLCPAWREDITEVETPLPLDAFIKTPHCLCGPPDFDLINAEIDVMELLSKTPHPNICKYYECIRDGTYIAGICLRKYKFTLQDIIGGRDDRQPSLDVNLIVSDVKAGLDFIHSLGLVHDDINPRNIMLGDDGRAVIIGFDSCVPLGAKSRGGTPGWSTCPEKAQVENDEYGLELVTKYIRGEYDGQDVEVFGM